jgi:hypothetical protein
MTIFRYQSTKHIAFKMDRILPRGFKFGKGKNEKEKELS